MIDDFEPGVGANALADELLRNPKARAAYIRQVCELANGDLDLAQRMLARHAPAAAAELAQQQNMAEVANAAD